MKLRNFFPFFLAPDADPTGSVVAPPAVSAESSPTGMDIPQAPSKAPAHVTQITPDAPAKSDAPVKQKGVLDVKKALGLSERPSVELDKEAKKLAEDAKGSTVIPVPKAKKKPAPDAPAAPGTDDAAKKSAEDKKAADDTAKASQTLPIAAVPAVPVKIKLGGKEMTPEEAEKYIAELEAKANTPAAPVAPAKTDPEAPKLTPEQQKAEEARLDAEETTRIASELAQDEKLFEKLGFTPEEAKFFTQVRARDSLNHRKWAETALNPILADFAAKLESLDPVLKMHTQISQYQAEAEFFAKPDFSDLKPFQATVRNFDSAMRTKYPKEVAAMKPEEYQAELAKNVRHFLKENNIQAPAASASPAASPNAATPTVATPAPTPTPKPPQPKPPTGNLTTSPSPSKKGTQGSMIAELEAHGK